MVLHKYAEYQPFGLAHIHSIPKHWAIKAARAVFEEKHFKNTGLKQTQVLSLSYGRILKKPADKLHGLVPASFEGYQIIGPGDIVMRPIDLQNDRVSLRFGISRHHGIITSAYLCLKAKKHMINEYAYQVLNAYDLMKIFYGFGSGLRQNINFSDLKYLQIPVPPRSEQDQIVAYLRAQDAHIACFIKAKRDLIRLLTEQKLRIIDHAVTRGLDATVTLKPSGIEWLGEVPEHWEVKPLKRWVRLNARTLGQKTSPDFEFRYVDIGSVQTGRLVKEPERIRFEAAPSRARRVLRRGDTIISTVRTYLKAIWYVSEDADDLIASTGFAVLTPGSGVEPEYLGYVIQSNPFVNRVTANSIGIAYPAIAETVLGRFPVALPPTMDEQQAIVARIKTESAPLDDAITRAEEEIKLIREYRDRLIADVVTGQIDVRSWQPGPEDVVNDAALAALGDENEEVTEEEDDDGED